MIRFEVESKFNLIDTEFKRKAIFRTFICVHFAELVEWLILIHFSSVWLCIEHMHECEIRFDIPRNWLNKRANTISHTQMICFSDSCSRNFQVNFWESGHAFLQPCNVPIFDKKAANWFGNRFFCRNQWLTIESVWKNHLSQDELSRSNRGLKFWRYQLSWRKTVLKYCKSIGDVEALQIPTWWV